MTTNEIEEIVREFQKKFVREEKDPNIGGWHFKVWEHPMKIIDWLAPRILAYGEKCREEERERIKDLFDEYNEMDDNAIQFELRIRKVVDFMKKFNSNH